MNDSDEESVCDVPLTKNEIRRRLDRLDKHVARLATRDVETRRLMQVLADDVANARGRDGLGWFYLIGGAILVGLAISWLGPWSF